MKKLLAVLIVAMFSVSAFAAEPAKKVTPKVKTTIAKKAEPKKDLGDKKPTPKKKLAK